MAEKKLQIICNTDKYKNFKKGEDVTNYLFGRLTKSVINGQYFVYKFTDIVTKKRLNSTSRIGLRHPKTHNYQYYAVENFIFK